MHRTHGDGLKDEGGYNRFEDQNLPLVPGTVDTAEYNNAVQEEIANVIEMCGGTLNGGGNNGDPAADRAAGWHQLYDTIFQNGNITDAAIDGITFSKLSGTINLEDLGPPEKQWYQDIDTLLYKNGTDQMLIDATQMTLSHGTEKVQINYDDTLFQNSVDVRINGRGIRFPDGPGDSADFKTRYFRKSLWNLTSIPWAPFLDTNGDNTGIYTSPQDYVTDIPDTVTQGGFISAWVQYLDGSVVRILPATVDLKTSGGFWVIDVICINVGKNSASPNPTATIILEYDAQTL